MVNYTGFGNSNQTTIDLSKNSFCIKSLFTPAAALSPSAAAIINCAGANTEASPAALLLGHLFFHRSLLKYHLMNYIRILIF